MPTEYTQLSAEQQLAEARGQLLSVETEHFRVKLVVEAGAAGDQDPNKQRLDELAARKAKLQKIVAGLEKE